MSVTPVPEPLAEAPSRRAATDARPWDGVLVVPMRRRHLRGVVAIEQQVSHRPWSLALFLGELRMPTSRLYLVALDGHQVVGFAGLMQTADEGHVTNVGVHPDHRRRHVASRLLEQHREQAADRGVRDATLEVRVSNTAAQGLYRRFGFVPGGVRRNYYSDIGEDALIMWAHGIDEGPGRERREAAAAGVPVALVVDGVGR
jgi:[ribosomal protein S18]-alanine N-acetyltransferase